MLTALKLATKVVDNVGARQLKSSRLTCRGSECTVLSRDGDNTLISRVPVAGNFDVVVDPKHLGKVLGQLKDGVLTQAESKLKITSGKRSVAINTVDRELFSEVTTPQCVWVSFNRERFLKVLEFVSACTSRDTTRYHLWGMLVNFSPRGIEMVATNSHGVHRHVVVPECGAKTPFPDVATKISAGSISVLTALLKCVKTTSVKIGIDMNGLGMPLVYCQSGVHELEIKTEEVLFPKWESVVPELGAATCRFAVEAKDLIAALKLCQATTGSVSTTWTIGESLVVSADDRAGANTTEETVEIVGTSDMAKFGINAEYVRAALEGLDWSRVEVRCSGPLDPVRFVDLGNPDYLAVIMPEKL